jgi:hypothetical protein
MYALLVLELIGISSKVPRISFCEIRNARN